MEVDWLEKVPIPGRNTNDCTTRAAHIFRRVLCMENVYDLRFFLLFFFASLLSTFWKLVSRMNNCPYILNSIHVIFLWAFLLFSAIIFFLLERSVIIRKDFFFASRSLLFVFHSFSRHSLRVFLLFKLFFFLPLSLLSFAIIY